MFSKFGLLNIFLIGVGKFSPTLELIPEVVKFFYLFYRRLFVSQNRYRRQLRPPSISLKSRSKSFVELSGTAIRWQRVIEFVHGVVFFSQTRILEGFISLLYLTKIKYRQIYSYNKLSLKLMSKAYVDKRNP